jgi:hypothetical protein
MKTSTSEPTPHSGQIALKLLVAKYYRSGMDVRKQEIERRVDKTVEETGLSREQIAELFSVIMIPAAAAGAVTLKDEKLTCERVYELVEFFTAGNKQALEKLQQTSLKVVRLEGRQMSIFQFEEKQTDLARSIGVAEKELREFYLHEILLPAIGHLFGCQHVGIEMHKQEAPKS